MLAPKSSPALEQAEAPRGTQGRADAPTTRTETLPVALILLQTPVQAQHHGAVKMPLTLPNPSVIRWVRPSDCIQHFRFSDYLP